jgi:MFS family permease
VVRQPFVAGVFGGFGQYLSYRLIRWAVVAEVLVYAGYSISTTFTLYTQIATGEPAQAFLGYQNTLRFGCKIVAGFFLGWLLRRTHPKAGMLVTCALCMAAVAWALTAPGVWFLLSFGLIGAGELFGIYYPNYILSCSPKSKMRRNMAFTSMMMMPAGVAPVLFGTITDRGGELYGKTAGFQISFLASLAILAGSFLVVLFALPVRPRPRAADMEPSDRELAATVS